MGWDSGASKEEISNYIDSYLFRLRVKLMVPEIKNIPTARSAKKHNKKHNNISLARLMIGARIRVARLHCELEQRDFSKKAKLQQARLSRLESGLTEAKASELKIISDITGFDLPWFYKD
jgi:ribosome-binding protein aMBF1 (putative translation factor)